MSSSATKPQQCGHTVRINREFLQAFHPKMTTKKKLSERLKRIGRRIRSNTFK